jgi:hypothetical protein
MSTAHHLHTLRTNLENERRKLIEILAAGGTPSAEGLKELTALQSALTAVREEIEACGVGWGGSCTVPRTISVQRALSSTRNREKFNDPWYAKVAFGLFLCALVGSLVALYSGVPVVQFVTRGL